MAIYIMQTRLSPEALTRPQSVAELNTQVEDRIKKECPTVKWLANYAVLGPCDYLDIFEAPDADTATKVALIVRSFEAIELGEASQHHARLRGKAK
ncbi:MAG: GYD domain-containing protein [Thermodesulfobacteriota bacterium]